MVILHAIISHLQAYLVPFFACASGIFYMLWQYRGRIIQSQKVQMQKTTDDSELSSLKTQEISLLGKVQDDDKKRLEAEAKLTASLGGATLTPLPGTKPK